MILKLYFEERGQMHNPTYQFRKCTTRSQAQKSRTLTFVPHLTQKIVLSNLSNKFFIPFHLQRFQLR